MALPSTPGSSEPVEVIEHDEESGSLGDPTSKKKKLEAYKLRARRQSRGSGLGEEGESGGLRVSFYKHMRRRSQHSNLKCSP